MYSFAALGFIIEDDPQTQLSAAQAFKQMMQNADFATEFRSNMLMTIFFTLLGAGYEVYVLYKGVYTKQKVR